MARARRRSARWRAACRNTGQVWQLRMRYRCDSSPIRAQTLLLPKPSRYHSIMSQPSTPKRVSESALHDQTSIVFPNDLNTVGTLYGGRVLEQADRVAAVVAKRH